MKNEIINTYNQFLNNPEFSAFVEENKHLSNIELAEKYNVEIKEQAE